MARAKTKSVDTNLPVPQNDAEAEQAIARLGALQRDDATAKARHDAEVAALEEARGRAVKAFKEAETAIVLGLERWASVNRARLTGDGKTKTVQFPTGKVLWRDVPVSVALNNRKVSKLGKEVVPLIEERVAQIREALTSAATRKLREAAKIELAGVLGFLRVTYTLNREAMHDAPELAASIPGIGFKTPGEEFAVEPLASQISEVA